MTTRSPPVSPFVWRGLLHRKEKGICQTKAVAFDDPLGALAAQIENEERAHSGIQKYVNEIVGLIPGWFGKVVSWSVQRDRSAKQQLVIDVIKSEICRHEAQIKDLLSRSQVQREFVEKEWPPLVVDGLKKAENTRAEDRARTIGLILSHVLLHDPPPPADYVEEMMRVSMLLDKTDAEVLRQIVAKQGLLLPPSGALDENGANEAWHDSPPKVTGLSDAMLTSICSKLESLGLVRAVKPRDTWYSLKTVGTPFTLLEKGKAFAAFAIQKASGETEPA